MLARDSVRGEEVTAPRTCDCGGCPECLSTVRLNAIRAAQSAKAAAAEEMARALVALLFNCEHGNGHTAWLESKDRARLRITGSTSRRPRRKGNRCR